MKFDLRPSITPKLPNLNTLFSSSGVVRTSPTANRFELLRFEQSLGEAATRELAEKIIKARGILEAPLDRSEGRSIFIQRPSGALINLASEFDLLKLKGARLCKHTQAGIVLKEPNHLEPYPIYGWRPAHLTVNNKLDSGIAPSRNAFNGSLSESSAVTEFKAQKIANKFGIAFPAIFAIKLKHNSQYIKNGNDEHVAIACLGMDSNYLEVLDLYPTAVPLSFVNKKLRGVVDKEADCFLKSTSRMPREFRDSTEMASSIAQTLSAIGQAKRILYRDCHISRHVGHRGNIYIQPDCGKIMLSDFDSVLILPEKDRRDWGSQLFRDLFSECMRIGADTILNFNIHKFEQLSYGLNNSIVPFISNFFAGSISHSDSSKLIDQMLSNLNDSSKAEILRAKEAIINGKGVGRLIKTFCALSSISLPLLEVLYNQIKEDPELKAQGFELVDLNLEQRSIKFNEMIRQYQKTFEPPPEYL